LQKTFPVTSSIQHLHFWVKNYSESSLAMYLEDFENAIPEWIKLAYLPTSGLIRLRLTGRGADSEILRREMETQREKLIALLRDDIVSEEDAALENILDKLLKEKGLTLSFAESCTGGKLASLFTSIPGCSHYFKGSVVSYSNASKQAILNVNPKNLNDYGAVSRPVVEQMAWEAQRIFNTDCAVATSGIAGPGGGTAEKPVGTVWIAAVYKDKLKVGEFHFSQNRESNILRSCNCGMMLLLELLTQ
jgi:nicotinamide-nucleotide amidase